MGCSGNIIKNVKSLPEACEINIEKMNNKETIRIIKLIYNFKETVKQATEKNEPSILARFLIDLSKAYSSFYNEYKIMSDDEEERNARVYITYITGLVLKIGMNLLGIEMPEEM